jgi:hypothetical protein
MSDEKKVQVLPFHAVNEFMRDDYRTSVITEVLSNLEKIDKEAGIRINRLFSKGVQIPGFRNSSLAPLVVKIKHAHTIFEKSAEFVAIILNSWSLLHIPLQQQVWKLIDDRNWKPLPLEVDRSLLPGFQVDWPKGDTFEVLIKALKVIDPATTESDDNISLMTVWVGNRLPYDLYEEQKG